MTRLLLATTSADKVREIRTLLAGLPVTMYGLGDFPRVAEPEETGTSFAGNARLKATYYDAAVAAGARRGSPLFTVAEDSGLAIDALGGEPRIYSARFLRSDASYPERFAEIERRLAAVPDASRRARFVCALAVVRDGTVVYETEGTVEGEIAADRRGSGGFGYDPIFFYPPYGRTLAEVDAAEKLAVAHRGVALRAFAAWLRARHGVGG